MLRVGIIGAGGIAGMHSYCYQNIPEAKVVAVADIVPERAERIAKMFGAAALDHGDKILERDDVDVVDICLPTYLHCEYTLKAAEAKKHVLCEKPMAISMEEGKKMIDATKRAGVKFMIAHVLRYFPEYISAKQIMESGRIGMPRMVRTYRGGSHPARAREWYGIPEKSGGAIQDMAIHDIDFLKWCFGPVKEVYAKGNVFKRTPYLEYDLVTIEFYNGVIAHVVADWSRPEGAPFVTKLEVAGTRGIIEYDSTKAAPLNVMVASSDEKGEKTVAIPESPLDPQSNPYVLEIKEFLRSVEKDEEPPISGIEALESLNIALAALESIRTGKPVKPQEVC
ncbi:Predicted dehydrogenase [Caldanaerobius fijiensis DSM 17918]|uniref:Predicted dehydrogenase n=1 Tax=Caldanaerobius fijiensis DSM 17918 TaxID=1121256 RepID=A0A1M5AXT2_9THEO|nr:Gfo/Idh/MocA family oxidoreductase [Caldanaerobius fijiensis]SHF35019.1 Predicted dehydrogenase [Caldanaerobius fijiensis DSM 17918]